MAGLDASPAMIRLARERLGDEADPKGADLTQPLPYDAEAFDGALPSSYWPNAEEYDFDGVTATRTTWDRSLSDVGVVHRSGLQDLRDQRAVGVARYAARAAAVERIRAHPFHRVHLLRPRGRLLGSLQHLSYRAGARNPSPTRSLIARTARNAAR